MVHTQHQRTSRLAARRTALQLETGHAWLTVGNGVRKAGQGRLWMHCWKQGMKGNCELRGLEYAAHLRHCQKCIPSGGNGKQDKCLEGKVAIQSKNLTTPQSLWTTSKHIVNETGENGDSYYIRKSYRLWQTMRAELLGVMTRVINMTWEPKQVDREVRDSLS